MGTQVDMGQVESLIEIDYTCFRLTYGDVNLPDGDRGPGEEHLHIVE